MLVGHIRSILLTVAVAVGLVLWLGAAAERIEAAGPPAQDAPPPPGRGEIWFQSSLNGPDVFEPGACPTGAASGENVDDGFKLTVRGRCLSGRSVADVSKGARAPLVGDGEVALDFKVVSGSDRAGVNLHVRLIGADGVTAFISPSSGQAELFKRAADASRTLASRQDLGDAIRPSDWNRLALRLSGGQIWVLINDEPILYAIDAPSQDGAVGLQVLRDGNPDDSDEVAVVFRDLTFSKLDGQAEDAPANPTLRP